MKLDDRIFSARTDLDEMFADAVAPPASGVRTAHRRRRAAQFAAGALAVVAVAVGVTAVVNDDPSEPVILTPPATDSGSAVDVTARLELSATTVEPGGTIAGALVVDNRGAERISAGSGNCWSVQLTNEFVQPVEAFRLACGTLGSFPVGESRRPFTVRAHYLGTCGERAPNPHPCSGDGTPVPLPSGRYNATLVTLVELPFAVEPSSVTVTDTTVTTTASGSTTEFPAEREQLEHGGTTWAVVLGGAFVEPDVNLNTDPTLAAAVETADAAGYSAGPTDCDVGAKAALGIDPNADDFYTVSVYFGTEADARQALQAFHERGHDGGAVAQVQTFCLD